MSGSLNSVLFLFVCLFVFFQGTNKLSRKKNATEKHLAAVLECRTILVSYYNNNIIIIQLACAYNTDDLYHTGRINPPGIALSVTNGCKFTTILHGP